MSETRFPRWQRLLGDAQQYAERWGRGARHPTWNYFRALVEAVDDLLQRERCLYEALERTTKAMADDWAGNPVHDRAEVLSAARAALERCTPHAVNTIATHREETPQ